MMHAGATFKINFSVAKFYAFYFLVK